MKLALEPLHPAYAGDRSCLTTTRDALDLCDLLASDSVGVAIDIYHVWWDTDLPRQLARAETAFWAFTSVTGSFPQRTSCLTAG